MHYCCTGNQRVKVSYREPFRADEDSNRTNLAHCQTVIHSQLAITKPIYAIAAIAGRELATTIQVSEETQNRLLRVAADLQAKLGHRVSYDEAIIMLIDQSGSLQQARDDFESLYGSLKNDKKAWGELRRLKRSETQRLERLGKSA